jgi:uncharacterized protein YndB with AHSA1/START domain
VKKSTVEQDIVYPHPLAQVWRALTDRASLSQWLLPNDFEPWLGHRFTFQEEPQDGWDGLIECEVVELVPLRRVAFTWSAHPELPRMVVSFTLKEVEGGTHLRLEQRELQRTHSQVTAINEEALPSLRHVLEGRSILKPRFFRIQVNEGALTDALFDFVADPSASRNNRPVVRELHTFAPEMVSVLENMILDGVKERHYIADYIHFVFGHLSA